jgi:cyclopropane-fatty-acyl-phospholipid synthase
MLDPAMQYSCAYFRGTRDLAEAQRHKLDLICRKLGLEAGMRLLDIGCGWGGLAQYAARHYGCRVVGITISREQQAYATASCQGLPIEIRLQDYRDISESFDRIVSVGMVEHVGYKNFRSYMQTAFRCLKDDGLFLCHTIGCNGFNTHCDPWISRYIFPNSMVPSATQITQAAEGLFTVEDVHNFGADYDHTLMAWEGNFRRSWDGFKCRYGERFYRMWRFYLLSCAGAFRARNLQLFQFVFSKSGILHGYQAPRF